MGQSDNGGKKTSRKVILQATTILILLALLLVVLGYLYLHFAVGYKINDLINDIVGNLLGVLAAFLVFDILYNQLTQDAYTKETSQQITKTLMGDPEVLDAFSTEDKEKFIVSTISSIVKDDDTVDMLVTNMDKYFHQVSREKIRKSFHYNISVSTEFPTVYETFPGFSENAYFYVQEILDYEVKYLTKKDDKFKTKEVKLGFSFDKRSLDTGLLDKDNDADFNACIFNEDLDITKEAVDYFRSLANDSDRLREEFSKLFTPVIRLDDSLGELKRVELKDKGIIAAYEIDYDCREEKKEHSIRIIFHMPKLWDSIFEVTLVDPTKEPKITFDYIPDKMDVTMYSYLNKEDKANDGAYEQVNGIFDVTIKDEWIYPKSGIVFRVKQKY